MASEARKGSLLKRPLKPSIVDSVVAGPKRAGRSVSDRLAIALIFVTPFGVCVVPRLLTVIWPDKALRVFCKLKVSDSEPRVSVCPGVAVKGVRGLLKSVGLLRLLGLMVGLIELLALVALLPVRNGIGVVPDVLVDNWVETEGLRLLASVCVAFVVGAWLSSSLR